jgi:hypothetical protein
MDTTPLGYEQVEYRLVLHSNEELGVPIDVGAARKFAALDKQQGKRLHATIFDLTKGLVTSADEVDNIIAFLRSRKCAIPNIRKGTVSSWLRRTDLHPEARKLLELRAEAAHKGKVIGILRNVDPATGRIFHTLTYANAGTGRLSSHKPNMQNLHREEGDTAGKFAAIISGDIARIEAFGPVRQVLATCERALVAAEPGYRFFILDYSSIEYIDIAWLAGEQWVLDAFDRLARTGEGDPYSTFGRECVGEVEWARDFGKAVILPRIYGVGEERLREALLGRFPELDPDCDVRHFIKLFDKRHPRIRAFWDEILRCALAAIKRPGQEIDCGNPVKLTFLFRNEFLTMQLPSGRYVSYPFARIGSRQGKRGLEEVLIFKENRKKKQKRPVSSAAGDDDADELDIDDDDGRTAFLDCRSSGQPGFWGGPLAENAVSAVARDVMMGAVKRLTAAGYRIVLTVHDEIVAEVPDGFGSFEEFVRLALETPEWAPGMPVPAKARFGPRLAKIDATVEEWVTGDWSFIPLHKIEGVKRGVAGARKPKADKTLELPLLDPASPTPSPGSPPIWLTAAISSDELPWVDSAPEAAPVSDPLWLASSLNAPSDEEGAAVKAAAAEALAATEATNGRNAVVNEDKPNAGAAPIPEWLPDRERARRKDRRKSKAPPPTPPSSPPPPLPPAEDVDDADDGGLRGNGDGYPAWRPREECSKDSEADDAPQPPPAGDPEDLDPLGPYYIYEDARGQSYLNVERKITKAGKKYFPQYHWNGGQWLAGLPSNFLKVPFRLPQLLAAKPNQWIVVAAGEKDALTAIRLGFIATTNPGGEGKGQWTSELNMWFAGKKHVAIMEDNDKTGYAHVLEVAKALRGIVPDIRIVRFRELAEHGDLTDWIEADPRRGYAELLARIKAAEPASYHEVTVAADIDSRAVNWCWPGHLARGELEIFSGAPDVGKSQIHCFLIACLTAGKPWPNGVSGTPIGKVIMLTAEDNLSHTVKPRLYAAGADLNRVLILTRIHKDALGRTFLLSEDLDVLESMIRRDPEILFVTIDPITAYMGGGRNFDSHRTTDVRAQLAPIQDLTGKTNVGFSVITHPPKKSGTRGIDQFIGSQAFSAAPRLGHVVVPEMEHDNEGKPQPTGRYLYTSAKHNILKSVPTLIYRIVGASGGLDAVTGEEIEISRIQWEGESLLSVEQALAATLPLDKSKAKAGVIAFLLETLAAGPVLRSDTIERGEEQGFTYDQLRRARDKAGILAIKAPGQFEGAWWWMKPEHEKAWRASFGQEEAPSDKGETDSGA